MHHTIQFAVERSECGPGHHDREGPAADQSPRPLDRWSSREWNRTRAGRCEIVTAVIPARAGNLGGAPSCWHRFVCDGRAQWATGTSGSMLGSRQRASIPPVMAAPGGRQCSEQGHTEVGGSAVEPVLDVDRRRVRALVQYGWGSSDSGQPCSRVFPTV